VNFSTYTENEINLNYNDSSLKYRQTCFLTCECAYPSEPNFIIIKKEAICEYPIRNSLEISVISCSKGLTNILNTLHNADIKLNGSNSFTTLIVKDFRAYFALYDNVWMNCF
jgi:hypothetical protein